MLGTLTRQNAFLIAALVAIVTVSGPANAASRAVKPSDLIKAAKAATVSAVDYSRAECKDERTIEQWLRDAVGDAARSIRWSGGACTLTNKLNPLDAGTNWCAHASIAPKAGGPAATIEIFFEKPVAGRPGKAFAFRATVKTKDGWDYMRETAAFESNWGETYIPGYKPPDSNDPCG